MLLPCALSRPQSSFDDSSISPLTKIQMRTLVAMTFSVMILHPETEIPAVASFPSAKIDAIDAFTCLCEEAEREPVDGKYK